MKNPNLSKLLLFICVMPVMALGYYLLPDNDDVRENAYSAALAPFLATFSDVETAKTGPKLPEAEIISSEGRKVKLSSLVQGRVTVVNFWASWCAPCIEEMPKLAKFQLDNPEILIVPISLDMQKTLPELAKLFQNENVRDLRWFYDEAGHLRKSLQLGAYPTTYILDRKGRVAYILKGPADWSSPDAAIFGETLLKRF